MIALLLTFVLIVILISLKFIKNRKTMLVHDTSVDKHVVYIA